MKWTCWIAALFLCCGAANANAGLFGVFGKHGGCHDDGCCPTCAAPAECCEDPSCCAPAECGPACEDKCCPAEPTCCAPAEASCCAPNGCAPACENECCPETPSCCAPAECCEDPSCCAPAECAPACDNGCTTSHGCHKAKKKGCLSKLFGMFGKKKHGGCLGHGSSCCEESCCPEPSCCAPACEPECSAPNACN